MVFRFKKKILSKEEREFKEYEKEIKKLGRQLYFKPQKFEKNINRIFVILDIMYKKDYITKDNRDKNKKRIIDNLSKLGKFKI